MSTVTLTTQPRIPRRVQMTRHKAWRDLYPDAVIVDRRTRWGNPYRICVPDDGVGLAVEDTRTSARAFLFRTSDYTKAAAFAVERFADDLRAGWLAVTVADVRRELAGMDLACWCEVGAPCHADVLLKVANAVLGAGGRA